MKKQTILLATLLLGLFLGSATAQDQVNTDGESHAQRLQRQLDEASEELRNLIAEIKDQKIPLSRELNELETELIQLRSEYQTLSRTLARRQLDLVSIRRGIDEKREHTTHVSTVLSEFVRNFRARLHIAELPIYEERLDEAELAPSNSNLSDIESFQRQVKALDLATEQVGSALGGARFEGSAVTSDGLVREGQFLLLGPAALFRSEDGAFVGTAEQRLGSLEPTQVAFGTPEDAETAASLVASGKGLFPLDPTLGNAHKIEATNESFVEHVQAGGLVMIPIFAMAGLAFLVALYKFLSFLFIRTPSPKKVASLLKSVSLHDTDGVQTQANELKGPIGDMLRVGVEHLEQPRELIEEVMYESVLKTRLKLNSLLPFIAICAASAPLLGLLGTVTGIINTFKLLTVFGSGDVSNLSGGISEALITTKFGLIVAIPSLLIHAFLWRMAKGMVSKMESAAIAFANEVSRSPYAAVHVPSVDQLAAPAAPSEEAVRAQVKDALSEMLSPILDDSKTKAPSTTQLS